jgi:hypothetical protein
MVAFGVSSLAVIYLTLFSPTCHGNEAIERSAHDLIIRQYEDAIDRMQANREAERREFAIAIGAMATSILVLYRNGRGDTRENRKVISRLAIALDRLPCSPSVVRESEPDQAKE